MRSNDSWRIWDNDKEYGKLFFNRAIGKLSEMESSKAVAKQVAKLVRENNVILDAGCGSGHYLVSLDKTLKTPFSYHGIDATKYYIELANKAFKKDTDKKTFRVSCKFEVGDIFNLKMADRYADLVMCNNVLLHLPSIARPISELWRVTKRCVIIRTLIGNSSFRIKHITQPEEYSNNGEPVNYYYFNIYSRSYLTSLIKSLPNVKKFKFIQDNDFNPANIGAINYDGNFKKPDNMTSIVQGMQINNYIIEPWYFLIIER